ncbi:MAG TPA: hypothetical protein VMT63_08155 [Bacteroidales bacterium]|nr:hypothetical protein [Bacteroidales bacterium]
MKKVTLLFLLFSPLLSVCCQQIEPEALMTRRYISCDDIFVNVAYLIPKYAESGSRDTLNSLIIYWEKNCGVTEPLMRCKILLAIKDHEFSEDIYNNGIIELLMVYKRDHPAFKSREKELNYSAYSSSAGTRLDFFTSRLAGMLIKRTDLSPAEKFFTGFYSGQNDSLGVLRTAYYAHTRLSVYYDQEYKKVSSGPAWHGDIIAGAWIPLGNLHQVGVHPALGFRGGIKIKRVYIDGELTFRVGKSPNYITVDQEGTLVHTDDYFGGYIGLDIGYNLLSGKNNNFDLVGGIAYDGFDTNTGGNVYYNDNNTVSVGSMNLNAGLGYKRILKDGIDYLGFDLKYNWLGYINVNGTNLKGNAITINLLYGFSGHPYLRNIIKLLK